MPLPALLVSTTTSWLGTARIPRVLSDAGFDVALLTPRHSLAETSRYIKRIGFIDDNTTPPQWMAAVARMVASAQPRVVIPGDDMAFQLLAAIVNERRSNADTGGPPGFSALVRASLGTPEFYQPSVDKLQLPSIANAIGVRMPVSSVVSDGTSALAFASRIGYPMLLKRGHAFAGQGVAICRDERGIRQAIDAFAFANAREARAPMRGGYLAQAHVTGPVRYFHAAAWQGEILAGFALEKLAANPSPTGPPTVSRYFAGEDLRDIAVVLAGELGISGLFFAEFIVDERNGLPLLIEINRRVSPATHRGALMNVDLCAALFGALSDSPSTSRSALAADEEGVVAHFPQEWLRDPESAALVRHRADVPWDEPELFDALVKLRR